MDKRGFQCRERHDQPPETKGGCRAECHGWLLGARGRSQRREYWTSINLRYEIKAMPTTVREPLPTSTTKSSCQRLCGNLTVPYPFGIGSASGCYKNPTFEIICNTLYGSPKPFLPGPNSTEVFHISETQLWVKTSVATLCSASKFAVSTLSFSFWYPYSLASDTNELYVIGCNAVGNITGSGTSSLCLSECVSEEDVDPSCGSRHGCSQTPVSADLNP
ncbi:hypothetical protein Droror1_Dr00000372 [Drosera rotundifolia]